MFIFQGWREERETKRLEKHLRRGAMKVFPFPLGPSKQFIISFVMFIYQIPKYCSLSHLLFSSLFVFKWFDTAYKGKNFHYQTKSILKQCKYPIRQLLTCGSTNHISDKVLKIKILAVENLKHQNRNCKRLHTNITIKKSFNMEISSLRTPFRTVFSLFCLFFLKGKYHGFFDIFC